MSDEASPRPWRVEPMFNGVADARGEKVAANICPADAALIVDAVNSYAIKSPCRVCSGYAQKGGCIADERDRLRDQLAAALRLADECSRDAAAVHAGRARAVEEAQSEANRRADRLADIVRRLSRHLANYITSESENDLLREARAALGEDK